jgi:hypothetical protein
MQPRLNWRAGLRSSAKANYKTPASAFAETGVLM